MTGNHAAELLRAVRPPAADAPDAELLARFDARRDEPAFRELVRRHGPVVLGVCRRVAGHAQDAEDAFQAVFLTLARKAGGVRRPELLGNYLYGMAVRVARRARRAAARRRAREVQVAAVPEVPTPAADAWSDLAPMLDAELAALPAWYRAAVLLCDVQGLARAEAAARLGVPEGTLSSRLAAGRKKLADRLSKRGITLSAAGLTAVVSANGTAAVPARLLDETVTATLGGAVRVGVVELAREGVWVMRVKLAITATVMGSAAIGLAVLAAPQAPPKTADPPKQAEAKPAEPAAGEKTMPARPRVRKTIDFHGRASGLVWSDDGKKLAVVITNAGRIEFQGVVLTQLEGGTGPVVRVIDPDDEAAAGVNLVLPAPSQPLGFLPGGSGYVSTTREAGLINAHNRLEFWPAFVLPGPAAKEQPAPPLEAGLARLVVTKPERTCDLDDIAGYLYAFARDRRTFVNDYAETAPDGRVLRSGLRVIDAETGEATKTLVRVDGQFRRVAVSADLGRAFTLGDDGTAHLWDLTIGRPVWKKTLSAPSAVGSRLTGHARFARFSPDGRSVFVVDIPPEPPQAPGQFGGYNPRDQESEPAAADKRPPGGLHTGLNRIDARTGDLVPQWQGANAVVGLSGFSHDGRLLLTADQSETAERQAGGRAGGTGRGGFPPQMAVSRTESLSVWDADSGGLVKRWPGTASAAFSPAKPVLAIFETIQPNRPRGPAGGVPVYSSRLGFWDFAAPPK